MSNTTKALAMFGVALSLGVAALPLSSYAEATKWQEGNEDNSNTSLNYGGGNETNPKWVSTDTTLTLVLSDVLSIETSVVDKNVNLIQTGAPTTIAGLYKGGTTINVKSNNTSGYQLTIKDKDADLNLNNGQGAKITPIAATTFTSDKSEWGYLVGATKANSETITDFGLADAVTAATAASTWKAIKATAENINDRTANQGDKSTPEEGDNYNIVFGANVINGQAGGTYTDTVVFTATNAANTPAA